MGAIATAAGIVLGISFATFVALFGRLPVFRQTPIAWLHRLFLVLLPASVLAIDRRLTAGRFTASLTRCGNIMINDRHPTVLIFFLALLAGSEYLALPSAWPLLSAFHRGLVAVLVVLPYVFLYLSAATDPGTVTMASLGHHLRQYPYDFALFKPGAHCRTCNLLKPPRSKHCSVCKRCVGRLDHHCIFINNCVGANNHRWFLLLMLSTALLTTYAGCTGMSLISQRITQRYPAWSLAPWRARGGLGGLGDGPGSPEAAGRMSLQDWLLIFSWGLHRLIGLGSVSLLGLLICPLVWGLLVFNLWNVRTGQTTNESLKWSDWKIDMDDGLVFRRPLTGHGGRNKAVWDGHNGDDDDDDDGCDHDRGHGGSGLLQGRPPAASLSRWPVEAEHILVVTEDGLPPPCATDSASSGSRGAAWPGVGEWERVWKLHEVENLYDLGFWNNLIDVFVPGYQFNMLGLPSVEARRRGRRRR